jgi:hypothetical protein
MPGLSPASKLLCLIGTAIAVLPAQAEEFSWQLSGVTSHNDSGGDSTSSFSVVDATYYVNPIDDTGGPHALASFLNPTTRLSATASMSDSLLNILDDSTLYTLGATFVLPGERWYVGTDYSRISPDDTPYYRFSDQRGYGVQAGRYLGANTTLQLGWDRFEGETSFACPPGDPTCTGNPFESEGWENTIGIEVFHVRRFRSLTYSLQGSVSKRESEFESRPPEPLQGRSVPLRMYSVATELFPTERLGLRVGYSRPDSAYDFDTYDVSATWFVRPRIGVELTLSRTTFDGRPPGFSHSDVAGVRLIGRL